MPAEVLITKIGPIERNWAIVLSSVRLNAIGGLEPKVV